MREDRDLQKKIKREFETPEVAFDEWAALNGIYTDEPERVECPVLQPAENVGGRGVFRVDKRKALTICLPVFAFILAIAIALGCTLPNILFAPKIYGDGDATRKDIELQEITQQEDIYMFDTSTVFQTEGVSKDVLIQDESQVLLYTFQNCLVSIKNGEGFDGFYITYRIKLYPYYEFAGVDYFSRFDGTANIRDKAVEYKLEGVENATGYAKFSYGAYEYFIEANGVLNTVLNEDNFLNLLNQILI